MDHQAATTPSAFGDELVTERTLDLAPDPAMSPISHRAVLDALPRAVIVASASGHIVLWNAAAEQLYGWREPEVLGRPIVEVLVPPAERAHGSGLVASLAQGRPAQGDYKLLTRAGESIRVYATTQPLRLASGEVVALVGVSHDVTDLRVAEQAASATAEHLRLALETSRLGTWHWDIATGATRWDARLEELYGLQPGTFGGRLESWLQLLHPDDRDATVKELEDAVEHKRDYRVQHRTTWADGSVHWLSGAGKVLVDEAGNAVGTIGCTADVTDRVEADLAARRAVEDERLHRERLEFLAHINELLNDCNDRDEIMDRVTRAAVPRLGDWCAIFAVDTAGGRPAIVGAHVDPDLEAYAREQWQRLPYRPDAPVGAPRVIRTGKPELYPEIDQDLLDRAGLDTDLLHLVRRLELRSYMAVPLIKRGRILGAMLFAVSSDERRYGPEELTLAQALAGRVASSLENRRLSDEHRHIAQTLQRSLLPDRLPTIDGADLAVRYWASGENTEVGGDLYDVFDLDDGTFAIVVGDVCGSGPQAAAVTSLVRHNIRANAWRGDGPAAVLHHLNRGLLGTWPDTFCTVVYAVGRSLADGVELTVVSGGHPLPILVRADGAAATAGMPGLLIGAFEETHHQPVTVRLARGDTMVFYTDGATDLPPPHDIDPDDFTDMVRAAVSAADTAEQAADGLAEALEAQLPFAARHDDIALLVLRARA